MLTTEELQPNRKRKCRHCKDRALATFFDVFDCYRSDNEMAFHYLKYCLTFDGNAPRHVAGKRHSSTNCRRRRIACR